MSDMPRIFKVVVKRTHILDLDVMAENDEQASLHALEYLRDRTIASQTGYDEVVRVEERHPDGLA